MASGAAASTHLSLLTVDQSYFTKHEAIKKRTYESRIREVEHSTFTPLVFSATKGMAHEATIFYKRLSNLLSEKWKEPYASVLGWARCHLSFCLLQSAIQRIRGSVETGSGQPGHILSRSSGSDPLHETIRV